MSDRPEWIRLRRPADWPVDTAGTTDVVGWPAFTVAKVVGWDDGAPVVKAGDSFLASSTAAVGRDFWEPADPPAPEPEAAPADEMVSVKLPRQVAAWWAERVFNEHRHSMDAATSAACAAALTEDDRGADR